MSYNDDEQVEERSFRLNDEDADDPLEPIEETGNFVFEEEEDDPDKDH